MVWTYKMFWNDNNFICEYFRNILFSNINRLGFYIYNNWEYKNQYILTEMYHICRTTTSSRPVCYHFNLFIALPVGHLSCSLKKRKTRIRGKKELRFPDGMSSHVINNYTQTPNNSMSTNLILCQNGISYQSILFFVL